MEPQHIKSLFNRGFSYDKLGRFDAALRDYSAAIALQPRNSFAYYNRGITRDKQEDFAGAVADFSRAIELEPQTPDFYHNRGFSYRKQARATRRRARMTFSSRQTAFHSGGASAGVLRAGTARPPWYICVPDVQTRAGLRCRASLRRLWRTTPPRSS